MCITMELSDLTLCDPGHQVKVIGFQWPIICGKWSPTPEMKLLKMDSMESIESCFDYFKNISNSWYEILVSTRFDSGEIIDFSFTWRTGVPKTLNHELKNLMIITGCAELDASALYRLRHNQGAPVNIPNGATVGLIVQDSDDIWALYNLIESGDVVETTTVR